jgi:hypothetical protein
MATEKTVQEKSPEFLYVPIGNIVVLEQVRSNINIESDSFKSLMQSIKDKGILEPLLVTKGDGDSYTLICGERRLEAARQLELELVPVRVIEAGKESGETIALQLTENLQREDLNPIDQAKGILSYIQIKHPDKNYDVQGVMSELIRYKLKPDDLSDELVPTVGTILEITGKSITTLFNMISLLKLSEEIRAAIQQGNLPVSQGYLFAANLECPDLVTIFETIMKTPVTNVMLERMLTEYKKVKRDLSGMKPIPLTKQYASLRSIETVIQKGAGKYAKTDLEKFLDQLRALCNLVEAQVQAIPVPEKPPQV